MVLGKGELFGKEFDFNSCDFECVCGLIYQWVGIVLVDSKQEMVYSCFV